MLRIKILSKHQNMITQNFIPSIIERTHNGVERSMDIYTRLLSDRIIFLGEEVRDSNSNAIIAQFLFLQMSDPKKPIHFYINTPGGSVTSGMAIYDTMQMLIKKGITINTYCIGIAASMGSVLLAGGSKGSRFALPNCRVMIHQPLGGAKGQTSDILINARELEKWRKILTNILAKHSNHSYEKVSLDCDRDKYLDAQEALEYGFIDHILE